MKKLYIIAVSFFVFLLLGCNGHNEDESDNSPQIVASIVLSILDSDGNEKLSYAKNDIITLQAKVTDENNAIIPNRAVSFSASIGALPITSKLTNSQGIASVSISNESLALGAGSATASIGEISSLTIDYEYIDSSVLAAPSELTTLMTLAGVSVNRFKADQQVEVTTILTDSEGQGVANEIITFTADVGLLNTATALTDNQGKATVILTSNEGVIGAGVLTSSYSLGLNSTINNTYNYQILAADELIDGDIRLGYFDETNTFIEGVIGLSVDNESISAGGSLGLSVSLVDSNDNLITSPIPVTFISNCVQSGNANIDESVLSVNGKANATFEDIDCAGTSGADDIITASVTVNDLTNTASKTITITGEQLGSIEFISAEPSSIVLRGTGGQNQQEISTLTFKVKSQLGNVLAQQKVDFALSTSIGDISLSKTSGFTNSQGLITTQVIAGSVPTAVRVTATAEMNINGEVLEVQSQSDLLSINTGLPEQRSMTIAASVLNPEGHNISGEESNITVWLSDNFNNPVPDGTTVNFTTEGGTIEPSCSTTNGSCSVTWTSSQPRVDDHRITILATALGHETFFDTNGNNYFDNDDGNPIVDSGSSNNPSIDSGLDNYAPASSGFVDMSEAWRDDNENSRYDSGEIFLDYNNDQTFTNADGLFNGPQCQGSKCAADNLQNIHVRKALRLVMASSAAVFNLTSNGATYHNSQTGFNLALPDVGNGERQAFTLNFADTGQPNQTMPFGTTVSVALSAGTLEGTTAFTVGNSNKSGFNSMNFFIIQAAGDSPTTAILSITITSPSGVVTSYNGDITLL